MSQKRNGEEAKGWGKGGASSKTTRGFTASVTRTHCAEKKTAGSDGGCHDGNVLRDESAQC